MPSRSSQHQGPKDLGASSLHPFSWPCHQAVPHAELLSTLGLHPTHRPGTFPVPKPLPRESPSE